MSDNIILPVDGGCPWLLFCHTPHSVLPGLFRCLPSKWITAVLTSLLSPFTNHSPSLFAYTFTVASYLVCWLPFLSSRVRSGCFLFQHFVFTLPLDRWRACPPFFWVSAQIFLIREAFTDLLLPQSVQFLFPALFPFRTFTTIYYICLVIYCLSPPARIYNTRDFLVYSL
jgi:hypothetical protein